MKLPPIKRLFQFSLRTMLVVVVVLSVWLGITVRQARQQKAAVAWVKEMGGSVQYDFEWDKDLGADAKPPGPKWLRELVGVDYFAMAVVVELHRTAVTGSSPFRNLKKLDTSEVANLNLKKLDIRSLQYAEITDLTPLANLKNLRMLELELELDNTQVSDLTPLAKLENMVNLHLPGTPVTAGEVAKLQKELPNCKITH